MDRKEEGGRGRRAGKGWEWGGVLEAGKVDRKEGRGGGGGKMRSGGGGLQTGCGEMVIEG